MRSEPGQRRRWFPLALAAIVALAGARWATGLGPHSLYLDDQAMVVLARHAGVAEFFRLHAHCPFGFFALLRPLAAFTGTASTPLQLAAWVPALLLVAASAQLVRRVTHSAGAALLAAAVVGANPLVAIYAVRVKHYTLEALVTTVIAALAWNAVRRPSLRRCATLAAASTAGIVFAHSALIAAPLFLMAATSALVLRRPAVATRILAPAIAAGLALSAALYAWFVVGEAASAALVDYWSHRFLTLERAIDLPARFFVHAFPAPLGWLAPLALVGAIGLWRGRARPWIVATVLVDASIFALSYLERYPIGTGRLDLFSIPLTVVLSVTGLEAILGRAARSVRVRGALWSCATVAVATLGVLSRIAPYPSLGDRAAVESLSRQLRPGDHLLVDPLSNYALGLYGSWPVRLVSDAASTDNFAVRLDRAGVSYLPMRGVVHRFDPEVTSRLVRAALSSRPARLVFLASHMEPESFDLVQQEISRLAYLPRRAERRLGAWLQFYEQLDRVWFYDSNSGRLFPGPARVVPPIDAPSGPTPDGEPAGLRAHVYRTREGGRIVRVLETTRPYPDNPARRATLVRRADAGEWIDVADPRSGEVASSAWVDEGPSSWVEWSYPADPAD